MGMRFSILPTGASVLLIKGGNYRPKGEITQVEGELDSEKKKKNDNTNTYPEKQISYEDGYNLERKHKLCPPKKY